jgi:hypothetical protein
MRTSSCGRLTSVVVLLLFTVQPATASDFGSGLSALNLQERWYSCRRCG